jgi:steroid delta-isomerase-like uncharacterized protein
VDHEATMRRAYELLNAQDLDGFAELLADDFVEHEAIEGVPPTKEGVKQFFAMYIAAFPDLRMEVEDMTSSSDKVWSRVRCTGTQQGELMGMAPTGKSVDVQAIDIVQFGDDGRATAHWGITDTMTMMQQLGAIPESPPA